MSSREQLMAYLLLGVIVLTVLGAGGYFFILRPLANVEAAEVALQEDIEKLEKDLVTQRTIRKQMEIARIRSLPADLTLAEHEYMIALKRLADNAGITDYSTTKKSVDNSSRAVPQIAKGRPAYTKIAIDLNFKKTNMKALTEFLRGYYNLGIYHQITALSIKKDEDPSGKNAARRNNLNVSLTTEAIRIDGAENRRTLVQIPAAFAALGGGGLYRGLLLTPSAGRVVVPPLPTPTLSPVGRDYAFIVQKDPFNGPYKETPPPPKKPLEIARIDDKKVRTDDKPTTVRVVLRGDSANGATFTAIANDGNLFPEGALKVDTKEYTIELPTTSASSGSTTITVIATSADGKETAKTTFKVTVEEPPPPPEPKLGPDISEVIILIGSTPRSDGTAWARIRDNYNRLRYEIEATSQGVTVIREEKLAGTLPWKKDLDYDYPAGLLVIADKETATKRTFKVLAITADGLILADLRPGGTAETAPGRPPGGKGGGGFGGFGGRGGVPPKQGKADPLAALGGNRLTAVPKPKYYRWDVGTSLAKLVELPEPEARKILEAVKQNGPVYELTANND